MDDGRRHLAGNQAFVLRRPSFVYRTRFLSILSGSEGEVNSYRWLKELIQPTVGTTREPTVLW